MLRADVEVRDADGRQRQRGERGPARDVQEGGGQGRDGAPAAGGREEEAGCREQGAGRLQDSPDILDAPAGGDLLLLGGGGFGLDW